MEREFYQSKFNDVIRVRIKTWEEMEQEFGSGPYGFIGIPSGFTLLMEELMPADRIITLTKCSFHIQENGEKTFSGGIWYPREYNGAFIIDASMITSYEKVSLEKTMLKKSFKQTASLDEI